MALHLLGRPDLAEALWHGISGAIETGTNAISHAHRAYFSSCWFRGP